MNTLKQHKASAPITPQDREILGTQYEQYADAEKGEVRIITSARTRTFYAVTNAGRNRWKALAVRNGDYDSAEQLAYSVTTDEARRRRNLTAWINRRAILGNC